MTIYKNVHITHCGYDGYSGTYVNPRGGNDIYFGSFSELKELQKSIDSYFGGGGR